jgi:hypothetical protein
LPQSDVAHFLNHHGTGAQLIDDVDRDVKQGSMTAEKASLID